jgi:hypothetical protein
MLYLKCVIAGIAALVIAAVVLPVMGILLFSLIVRPPAGEAIAFDVVSIAKSSPTVWLIALIVFAAGFYWEFRRLTKRNSN